MIFEVLLVLCILNQGETAFRWNNTEFVKILKTDNFAWQEGNISSSGEVMLWKEESGVVVQRGLFKPSKDSHMIWIPWENQTSF